MVTTLQACECPRCHGCHFDPHGGGPCLLCDGRGHVEDAALSPHFRFSEMVVTGHPIPNDPDVAQIEALRRLCLDLLEPVRAIVGPLRVTSGYRSRSLNAHIGSSDASAHPRGDAADVVPLAAGRTLRDVMEAVQASGVPFDQAILEGGCVHLGRVSPGGAQRMQLLVRLPGPHPAGPKYIYARYTGDAAQVAAAV